MWFGHKMCISSNKKVVMRYFIKRNGDRYKCRVLREQIVGAVLRCGAGKDGGCDLSGANNAVAQSESQSLQVTPRNTNVAQQI